MGFRPHAIVLQWLGVIGILGVFALAMTWLAVIPGLLASTAGRGRSASLSADLSAVHQLGLRADESMPTAVRCSRRTSQ